jgi:xanthine dehydrogenase accessory factor
MDHNFYKRLSEFLDTHPKLALATIIDVKGSTPRAAGAKMIVFPDGNIYGSIGGGGLEQKVINDALEAMQTGMSFTKTYKLKGKEKGGLGQLCGGISSVHVEIIKSPDTLLLCGGGHVAHALAPMAQALGMNVCIIDERTQFATKERFPGAAQVLNVPPSDARVREMVTDTTFVVICTHNHEQDKEALMNLVESEAAYIGLIGSVRKVRTTMGELQKSGIPAKALKKVHAPIGLDIGAETPAEIAVSILAEIIHTKRKRTPSNASLKITALRTKQTT